MNELEKTKEFIKNLSDEELSLMIPKASLCLEINKIQTAHFAFWICYMAELDFGDILTKAWKMAKTLYGADEGVINIIKQKYGIKIEKIDPKDQNYNLRTVTFGDRISVFEKVAGEENELVKMLWKLKNIRDDLSHGRIDNLSYDGNDLELRATKEKLLLDYSTLNANVEFSESPIWVR